MKITIAIVLGLLFSSSVFALDKTTEEIQALCLVAKQGYAESISAKALIQVDGSVKLITGGGKGELSFSKSDWDGMQQVLKEHQASDNANARDCILKMMPYFKSKVTAVKATKPAAPKPNAKSESTKPDAADVHIETYGEKNSVIYGDGATVNYGN